MATLTLSVNDTLDRLIAWCERAERIESRLDRVTRASAREGNRIAQRYAARSSGHHGFHYPSSFAVRQLATADYAYGPWRGMQSGMSFEHGSRNQPPHLDLARSADKIGRAHAERIHALLDELLS